MPAYKFTNLPAGRPVTVHPVVAGVPNYGSTTTSGTTDGNGTLLATLTAGDYVARARNGYGEYVETAEELVTPFDPQSAASGTSGATVENADGTTNTTKKIVVVLDAAGEIDDLVVEDV